ncbi:hypothetical protein DFP94_1011401 [Fontibacillus phaseoli]|uniref:Uncharacterized protein n=1 Tax=Fontibacillus phaseoli TaxID=1416533 RepID=A0A369BQ90_9BACL|nr:hypothetical protein [Fontibacillus phaseoli]RCX23799.1 hypothetical protein DFP94_1011401 [Fontibacillus phaseoli]
MPYEHEPELTDGDPNTIYEDTRPHTPTGFLPEQSDIMDIPSDEAYEKNRNKPAES